jgi:hypothetical protein
VNQGDRQIRPLEVRTAVARRRISIILHGANYCLVVEFLDGDFANPVSGLGKRASANLFQGFVFVAPPQKPMAMIVITLGISGS